MKTSEKADPFYSSVINQGLKRGLLRKHDHVLVVCGGEQDQATFSSAGFDNVEVTNISQNKSIDVENLPFVNDAFDVVCVHSGLHHCASPHKGLLEIYRVSRRAIVLFEPADSLASRVGKLLGFGQTYEFSAVAGNDCVGGGWRNSSIPNWVYRFTSLEIRQTVCCFAPFGVHGFHFFYRTRIPWSALKRKPNKLPLLIAFLLSPVFRVLDVLGPVFSNNLAVIIAKPDLSEEHFPWLVPEGQSWTIDPNWIRRYYE